MRMVESPGLESRWSESYFSLPWVADRQFLGAWMEQSEDFPIIAAFRR
jgi:hypothetical protein